MFKAIVQSVLSRATSRCYERKCLNFLKTDRPNRPMLVYNFNGYNTRPISNKSTVCMLRINPLRHFSTSVHNYQQPGKYLDATTKDYNIPQNSNQSSPGLTETSTESVQGSRLFEDIDFDEVTGGDEENLNKFKLLILELDVLRQDGMKMPKTMSTEQWKEMLTLKTKSQRYKYLNFLWTVEIRKLSDKRKKEEKRIKNLEKRAQEEIENNLNDHIQYGFKGSTIFLRVYETTMNTHYNNKLIQAMLFGQNIVIDCGYDSDMTITENKLCAKQLGILFADNRKSDEPFNLHFCNMNRESVLFKQFKKIIPTIDDPQFPINLTEEHYLNLFPKEKIVYLTPHCRTELTHFNHDDVYIVGALIDKVTQGPLSLAKAKREGIRMAQFPLDRYLEWGLGTKSLTINQVLNILLKVRTTGDWNEAFKHVPKRKIRQPGEPIVDKRELFRRGTTIQPPRYERKQKRFFY